MLLGFASFGPLFGSKNFHRILSVDIARTTPDRSRAHNIPIGACGYQHRIIELNGKL